MQFRHSETRVERILNGAVSLITYIPGSHILTLTLTLTLLS